jgi:adhesin/invasin
VSGVVNGASYQAALAPGSIVSIFGNGLAGSTMSASTANLPPFLGSVNVYFNGIAAPLFYASPGQINAQVPYELTPGTVTVEVDGLAVARQTATVSATAPGIFTTNSSGTGPGAILRANDYQLVSQSTPTQAGAYILIYCTGLGALTNPIVEGNPGPNPPLTTVAVPQVTIGNMAAPVTFSGLAPGFAGLYQVNAQVPAGVPAGNIVPVTLAVNGVSSNTVTITVQ